MRAYAELNAIIIRANQRIKEIEEALIEKKVTPNTESLMRANKTHCEKIKFECEFELDELIRRDFP